MDSEDFPSLTESSEPGTSKSVMRKDFITPKLVAALDRCQLSMQDSVFILEAIIDVLGCNIDEFPISKSSIQRIRTEIRKERAEYIIDFQKEVLDVVTLHWDGKLLPALSARKSKEECLPVVISYGLKEQLIAVPRLNNSTGKEQVQAVWKAIGILKKKSKFSVVILQLQTQVVLMVLVCYSSKNLITLHYTTCIPVFRAIWLLSGLDGWR
ncbi:hypothetical protein AVEN_73789-1 [Araneus ventricosus]|uniref:Uncharacterized protein n=1 Tax=Araneus ventricosus TaxID=182803 RepID=A0A4Y2HDZ8_ARAVE|nr:hypothetical protein AVEN_73789-1 [Araneus ventricosus]